MPAPADALISLSPYRARRSPPSSSGMFPAASTGRARRHRRGHLPRPGAGRARPAPARAYRLGLDALDRVARDATAPGSPTARPPSRTTLIAGLEAGTLPGFTVPDQREFFAHAARPPAGGLFADPAHGGNRDKQGWRFLGHPGVWLEHSAEEHWRRGAGDEGRRDPLPGRRRLARSGGSAEEPPRDIPGYDPQRAAAEPPGPADVIIVGHGRGRRVRRRRCSPTRACGWSGFEAGPWRHRAATTCPTSSAPPTTAAATWGRSSWPRPRAGGATRASRPGPPPSPSAG